MFCKDKEFKMLMKQMLTKNPVKRLTKFEDVRNHEWFSGFNWDDLGELKMEPPYKPMVKSDPLPSNKINYVDYIDNCNKQNDNKQVEVKMNDEDKAKFDKWYKSF